MERRRVIDDGEDTEMGDDRDDINMHDVTRWLDAYDQPHHPTAPEITTVLNERALSEGGARIGRVVIYDGPYRVEPGKATAMTLKLRFKWNTNVWRWVTRWRFLAEEYCGSFDHGYLAQW